jgi:hypothetical protein
MHPKILSGLSLGLSFKFFEYLSFEFEYFENLLQISNKIIQNKKNFEYGLGINLDFFSNFKIDTQIHFQKIKF